MDRICLSLFLLLLAAVSAAARPAAVDLGYESGRVARRLSGGDRVRLAARPRQDLLDRERGRYTLRLDDGVLGHWGLEAVRARQEGGPKPYDALVRDGRFRSERVIFADLATGATMMKLTNDPYGTGDELIYFGKSCFSANGARMVWQRSLEPSTWGPGRQETTATHGPLVMTTDDAQFRIAFREATRVQAPICHPTNPELAYALSEGTLLELNLRTGEVQRTIAKGLPGWWLKLSPEGKYALSAKWPGGLLAVVSLKDGQRWDIRTAGAFHDSYRFLPGDTDWVMYWDEKRPTPSFHVTNFRTGEDRPTAFMFDWNHGDVGRYLGFHCSGLIYPFEHGAWQPAEGLTWPEARFLDEGAYYDEPVHSNGYAAHWPDDQRWAYGTRIVARPYLSEIEAFYAKPLAAGGRVNRFPVCLTNLTADTDRKGAKTVALDRPNISFDGTKLLFNSNAFGMSDVYLVVLKDPLPPTGVAARWTKQGVAVSWQAPRYHQEIAGYHVYRSHESGRGFELLSAKLVTGTRFVDRTAGESGPWFYALRSVEPSRLESELSVEVGVARSEGVLAKAPRRIFVEAEEALSADLAAPSPDAFWMDFDGLASDLHYLWQRRADRVGRAELAVCVPRAGAYYVYARVKGPQGATFGIGAQTVTRAATQEWRWVRSPGALRLRAGEQRLVLTSSRYGSSLDCLYLSTDADFVPKGRVRAAPPAAPSLAAAALTKDGVRLTWAEARDARWWHYNVYAADRPDFVCDRSTLVASPSEADYLDWQAPAGRKCYRVTQVTLDGLESAATEVGEVTARQ